MQQIRFIMPECLSLRSFIKATRGFEPIIRWRDTSWRPRGSRSWLTYRHCKSRGQWPSHDGCHSPGDLKTRMVRLSAWSRERRCGCTVLIYSSTLPHHKPELWAERCFFGVDRPCSAYLGLLRFAPLPSLYLSDSMLSEGYRDDFI